MKQAAPRAALTVAATLMTVAAWCECEIIGTPAVIRGFLIQNI